MANNLTRRTMLAASAAGAAWSALVPGRALALTNPEAQQLVGNLVDEINRAIAAGQSPAQMKATFKRIFNKYADVSVIARSALGVSARSASASQMSAFTTAFEDYLAGKYGARFNEFKGGTITVSGTQQVKSFYEVTSVAKIPGKSPLDVRWQVSDKSGRDLFFNIIIEGVNMLATERTEIGALLDKRQGNLDQLIRDLPTLA